jgi:hypothetical protein
MNASKFMVEIGGNSMDSGCPNLLARVSGLVFTHDRPAKLTVLGLALLLPSLAGAQELGAVGMSAFPSDTQQIAYINVAQLRASPNYYAIHRQLFDRRMDEFEMFMRQVGTDAEKDVDEILLGWRGAKVEREDFFGVASGRFEPERARQLAGQSGVTRVNYHGTDLYGFSTGDSGSDLFFTFFDEGTAAFGRESDLKVMVDLHSGNGTALDSNSDFVGWENELDGAAPQWGIATGSAATLQAAPWFAGQAKLPFDPATVMGPVKAVLYQVNWSGGFSAHLSLVCQKAENATALAQLITVWKSAQPAPTANGQPGIAQFIQSLQAQANGSRLEINASGPVELAGQVIRGPETGEP